MNFRQLATFVGVYDAGSFNRAAVRLNATQSGLSMQIKTLEDTLGTVLFERSAKGVTPTYAGRRLYETAVEILRRLDGAEAELRNLSGTINGPVRVGLMPTFTRGVLAPALSRFITDHPNAELTVLEGYSAQLLDRLAEGEADFVVVPQDGGRDGMRSRLLGTDREFLVTRPGGERPHLTPVRLADVAPLRLVLPARGNARRDRLDAFIAASGLEVDKIIDMDAMFATLEFVASSDYGTVLPATICRKDIDGRDRWLHPITGPHLTVNYVVVEPARKVLTPAAAMFLHYLEEEYHRASDEWSVILTGSEGYQGI
ncbi:MAG: LysR family transcriptional regulator [Paracoccaceae bacterium]|jgi:LysR family nitrogen assimilation transcriptional regulator